MLDGERLICKKGKFSASLEGVLLRAHNSPNDSYIYTTTFFFLPILGKIRNFLFLVLQRRKKKKPKASPPSFNYLFFIFYLTKSH